MAYPNKLKYSQTGAYPGFRDGEVQMFKILDPSPSQLGGLGSAVSSPSGVWGGAPAANDFGAFWTKLKTSGATWMAILMKKNIIWN